MLKEPFSINMDELFSQRSGGGGEKTNRFGGGYDEKKGKSRRTGKTPDFKRKNQNNQMFRFECPSENSKLAVNDIIAKVKECGTGHFVNFVDPNDGGKLKRCHFSEIINSTDFSVVGLSFIPPPQPHNGKDPANPAPASASKKLPIIKSISPREMVQKFSDLLAEQKEKELLEMGSSAARKALNHRLNSERKKSALKAINLSWTISIKDLTNQKRNEIEKRISKGERFVIFLGGRRKSGDSAREDLEELQKTVSDLDSAAGETDDIETQRRIMVVEKLQQILNDASCKYDEGGSVKLRWFFSCIPPMKEKPKTEESEKPSSKEIKKQRRLEKEKKRETKKTEEPDLDLLYLMKIED